MELQLKRMLMSTVEMRTEVHQMIDEVDNALLEAIHAMLGTYKKRQEEDLILGYDADGKPLHVNEAKKLFKAELEGVKRGEYMTIEEFEKESETW